MHATPYAAGSKDPQTYAPDNFLLIQISIMLGGMLVPKLATDAEGHGTDAGAILIVLIQQ